MSLTYEEIAIDTLVKIAVDKDTFVNSGEEDCWDANIEIWNKCYNGRNLRVIGLPMIGRAHEEPTPHFELQVIGGRDTWVFEASEANLFEIV